MEAERRRQNDLSRANIVRAQVIFLFSTLTDDNWEEKLQEFKKVNDSPRLRSLAVYFAVPIVTNGRYDSWRKNPALKSTSPSYDVSSKSVPRASFRDGMGHRIPPALSSVC
jgi:hypothetical protein